MKNEVKFIKHPKCDGDEGIDIAVMAKKEYNVELKAYNSVQFFGDRRVKADEESQTHLYINNMIAMVYIDLYHFSEYSANELIKRHLNALENISLAGYEIEDVKLSQFYKEDNGFVAKYATEFIFTVKDKDVTRAIKFAQNYTKNRVNTPVLEKLAYELGLCIYRNGLVKYSV